MGDAANPIISRLASLFISMVTLIVASRTGNARTLIVEDVNDLLHDGRTTTASNSVKYRG